MTICQSLSTSILPFRQLYENTGFDTESRATLAIVPAGDFVLKHLKANGVTPKQLKDALGVSASMASRMLDGSRGISVWHLDALAELLETTVPQLFTARDLPDHADRRSSSAAHPQAQLEVTDGITSGPTATRVQQQHAALLAATEEITQRLITTLAEQGVTVRTNHVRTRKGQSHARTRPRKAG